MGGGLGVWGDVRGSGEGRTRPSAVQLVKRHESPTLMANMFHRKRVQTKLRVGQGNPSKHKTVQIKFYGAKAIPGKYYSLYGVNRQQHGDVCMCRCVSKCTRFKAGLSTAQLYKYQLFIMLIDINSLVLFLSMLHTSQRFFTHSLSLLFKCRPNPNIWLLYLNRRIFML